jgi:hypothetical protein
MIDFGLPAMTCGTVGYCMIDFGLRGSDLRRLAALSVTA